MSAPYPDGNRKPQRHRYRILVALAVLLCCAGLWWGWRWYTRPELPEIQLEGADPEVQSLVREAQETVRQNPRSADAWGSLGMALLAHKLEEASVAPFTRAEALDPSDPRWPYLRGIALLGWNPDEALPCLRRAAAACRDSQHRAAAHLRLAETLAANGYNDEALIHFREVPPGALSPCVDYGLGALAAVRGDLAAAKDHLTRCANSPLTQQKASAQLATLARRMGEEAKSAEYGKRAGQLPADPPWPDPFLAECLALRVGKERRMQLVNTLEQRGQVAQALELLREIARDYPDAQSFLTLGITLGRRGYYQESEAYLRKCLAQEPGLVRAQYYLSLALFAQGEALKQRGDVAESTVKFEDAARWARQATKLDPRHGEAHFQLGLTLVCLGRRAEAITAFHQAVATRPELADAHLWLGKTLAEDGKKEQAVRHLRDAARYAAADDPRPRQALEQLLGGSKP